VELADWENRLALHLLARLQGNQAESPGVLAAALGVPAERLRGLVSRLRTLGLPLAWSTQRVCLTEPRLRILERPVILAELRRVGVGVTGVEHLVWVRSTNERMTAAASAGAAGGCVCIAEIQSAGRGRRGRSWCSPFARNIYLSLLWRPPPSFRAWTHLSLAAAVALARSLEGLGLASLELKWPNDLKVRGRKLGGILVEGCQGGPGGAFAVLGVGLNHRMDDTQTSGLQPWTDLGREMKEACPDRSVVAGRVIASVLQGLEELVRDGWRSLRPDWDRLDGLAGREVLAQGAAGELHGIAEGLAADGGLWIRTPQGPRLVYSAEVTVRAR
jgi:BirA family biotin operon repressor/biotin-[acetyl-CoA-carboxylase] ligase